MEKPTHMLEREIEAKVCVYARSKGILAYKFNSMNRAAVPDRMFITDEGYVWFCEFKRKRCKPTVAQEREHERLRSMKMTVFVIDSVEDGKLMIDVKGKQDFFLKMFKQNVDY